MRRPPDDLDILAFRRAAEQSEGWMCQRETALALFDRLDNLAANLREIRTVVDGHAEDDGLWFVAQTGGEAYLQQELRHLHAVIEGADQ